MGSQNARNADRTFLGEGSIPLDPGAFKSPTQAAYFPENITMCINKEKCMYFYQIPSTFGGNRTLKSCKQEQHCLGYVRMEKMEYFG